MKRFFMQDTVFFLCYADVSPVFADRKGRGLQCQVKFSEL